MNFRFFSTLSLLAATAWAGPLKIEPGEIDFGTKSQNLHLESEVKLTNTTDKELDILSVASDCSCTAGEPKQRKLAPGATTTMPVAMDTRHYQGAVARRLTIFTSLGSDELRVRATIRAFENWEVVPTPVMLPTSLRNQEASTIVNATYVGTEKVSLLGATTNQPWLGAEFTAAPNGGGGSVLLRKAASAPAGPLQAQLTLKTSDPKQRELTMSVFVSVVSAAKVTPNPIILPTVKAGTESTREVVVSGWEEPTAPRAKVALGTVQAKEQRANGDYVFVVALTPANAGMSTQMLQLGVDANSVLIEVPVILKADAKE